MLLTANDVGVLLRVLRVEGDAVEQRLGLVVHARRA